MAFKVIQARERSRDEITRVMHPAVKKWFFSRFIDFSLPQLYGVLPIFERKNILISAPTGGTKTLTGCLSIINYLVELASKNELEEKVYCVYVSPLKALNNDIYLNLLKPLEEINNIAKSLNISLQDIRISVRTGDTTQKEKQQMLKKPPHILITTPESLSIVLSSIKFNEFLRGIEFVILDEIHALANKRGVHLSLSIERLKERSEIPFTRIGLSATVAPLDEIARFLSPNEDCIIADVQFSKKIDLKVLTPVDEIIDTDSSELRSELYKLIDKLIQEHKTTLIFTNTRSATERVVHHLKEMFPSRYLEDIGAHHSSLSKEMRFEIEERLRQGQLKCIVCSTSLELGIDIGYIDLVILLGSPKSSARALQRCLSYGSKVLCWDGKYREIGEIVEKKLDVEAVSYDKKRGFVKNKIKLWHKNKAEKTIKIKLKCGEEIECTEEHPILTSTGWKNAENLNKTDLIAELRNKIDFELREPYLFELLPKDKIFVANKNNFFQKIIDRCRRNARVSVKEFSKNFEMPYSRLIDCRRLRGRKKSIRLDYFLKGCELCGIGKENYLPYLESLKTKGAKWPKIPLKLTEEIMWLGGIIATDGCIVRSQKKDEAEYYKIKIGNKSKTLIDKVREIVLKFEIKPYESVKEGLYNIEFGSNLLSYLFMSLGIPCKNKSFDIEVNNNVFSLPSKLVHAYLEGIFEGDGNLNIRKNENHGFIRIFSASKKFALGLHSLLNRLGYQSSVMKSRIKTSKLIKKVSGGYLHCVFISRKEDLRRFFEDIPCYGKKAITGRELTKNFEPYLSAKVGYNMLLNYSEIESIEIIDEGSDVYNLSLDEPNNFIVGNIIVHNCGRSGHKLHEVAKGRFIVLDRDELIESCVLMKEAIEKKIDRVRIPRNCLDVLAQHIYGMAIDKTWNIDEMFNLIRGSYCYSNLSKEDFYAVISYLAGEYALEARNVYAKIWYDPETKKIGKRGKLARMIYMTNIGTIPEESFIKVVIAGGEKAGQTVGMIDEGFLERMKPRDVFVLGGEKYEFLYTRGMKVYVKASVYRPPTIPSWFSEMLPLSFDSAIEIGRFRRLMEEKFDSNKSRDEIKGFIKEFLYCDEHVAEAVYQYFYEQYNYAEIPNDKKIVIEHYKAEKNYVLFHSLFGRRVNDALSRAFAYCAGMTGGRDVEVGINDNGFYLAGQNINIDKALGFLNDQNIGDVLKESVERSEVLKRRFRHCATRALMILRSYKGRSKSVGKQQLRSGFLLGSVRKISTEFPILKEARREVLEDLMDIENTREVLRAIRDQKIRIKQIRTKLASPFALSLVLEGYGDLIKMEDKMAFLKRMHDLHLKSIEGGKKDEV